MSCSLATGAVLLTWTPVAFASWVDPDTPVNNRTTLSLVDGRRFDLVFSDEFNVEGRTFNDGHDPRWTALHKNDYTNTALQFYDKGNVVTAGGCMNITTTAEDTTFLAQSDKTLKYHLKTKHFKSAMVQTWNKFCFTGGIIEVRAKLPGRAYTGGLWPAIWLMGNLARATYVGSSNWIWPWSFEKCDRDLQPKQLVSACSPHPHYGFEGYVGRGAPEMDILEAMPGYGEVQQYAPTPIRKPYFSTSFQLAPGVDDLIPPGRPSGGGPPAPGQWYEDLEYGRNSSQNIFFYGSFNEKPGGEKFSYFADAISGNTQLDEELWRHHHTFKLEWAMKGGKQETGTDADDFQDDASGGGSGGGSGGASGGASGGGSEGKAELGYMRWYMDDKLLFGVTGRSLHAKRPGATVPTEPQYLLLNTAMSSSWGFPGATKTCENLCYDCSADTTTPCGCGLAPGFCASLPAVFSVDFVRVYQDASDPAHKAGCSTPERPSKKWIAAHVNWFKDEWDDQPLQSLAQGGAPCEEDVECGGGGGKGQCRSKGLLGLLGRSAGPAKACVCAAGWTGPSCRASVGFDPVDWDPEETLGPVRAPILPGHLIAIALLIFFVLATATGLRVAQMRTEKRLFTTRELTDPASPAFSYGSLGVSTRPLPSSDSLVSPRSEYSMARVSSETQLFRGSLVSD